jgi:calcineurin-like phosphoesterase family protein
MAFTTKFYTADTHFGHQLMLDPKACGRPFADTREMDEFLIRQWNSVVKPDDLVYHLGDVFFGMQDEGRCRAIFSRLQGRKILILGNHDYKKTNVVHPLLESLGWEDIAQHYQTTDEGQHLFLSHYAQRTWPKIRKGGWHFFGHCHGSLSAMGRSRDVGVDCPDTGYAPRTFKQLTAGMKSVEPTFEEGA